MRLEAFGGSPGVLERLIRRETSPVTSRPRRWGGRCSFGFEKMTVVFEQPTAT